jgi:two-component system response regulator PilR (NtrC family)
METTNLDQFLADLEIKMLQNALQMAHGVKLKAAELLGITFRSFRYRLLKYGLASEEE